MSICSMPWQMLYRNSRHIIFIWNNYLRRFSVSSDISPRVSRFSFLVQPRRLWICDVTNSQNCALLMLVISEWRRLTMTIAIASQDPTVFFFSFHCCPVVACRLIGSTFIHCCSIISVVLFYDVGTFYISDRVLV